MARAQPRRFWSPAAFFGWWRWVESLKAVTVTAHVVYCCGAVGLAVLLQLVKRDGFDREKRAGQGFWRGGSSYLRVKQERCGEGRKIAPGRPNGFTLVKKENGMRIGTGDMGMGCSGQLQEAHVCFNARKTSGKHPMHIRARARARTHARTPSLPLPHAVMLPGGPGVG